MHWLLSVWICTMPGWGECRPQAVRPEPTLALCRAAARVAMADAHNLAHCHLRARYRASQRGTP
jgi:hypothetical protein